MMADIHGSPGSEPQMPASNAGPAPVPYPGGNQAAGNPSYMPPDPGTYPTMGSAVMSGVSGTMGVQESGYAHDVNGYQVSPYYAGDISPISTPGSGPEGSDIVSGTVGGAVQSAEARFLAHLADSLPQGSAIGVQPPIPQNSLDPAVGSLGPLGSYYDPPRDY